MNGLEATLLSIDNSHIVTGEPQSVFSINDALDEQYILSDTILNTNKDIYELLCTQVGYNEDTLRQCAFEIQHILSHQVLQDIFHSIPSDWSNSVGSVRIEQLFDVLNKRSILLSDIAEMIIEERRKL